MKKYLILISLLFTSLFITPDTYEDEVRKRLGLLKDLPVVAMLGMSADESDGPVGRSGEAVYNQGCAACHTAGLAGAPMFASLDQWTDRTSKGLEVLTANAYNGYNAMPAKGMCIDCSQLEIERSVQYMLDALTVTE
ncbi:MAG: cytochrome c5 family protein [Gammaproteobacteria bacterium TMED112]|nr:MAG: cytochrome c5 family protein [Gammaproteobacteria bacterium TMED112]|tara:strand:- start:13587 stop:13997 length:411 start_codon:yes stop_codon:yes gene_type:complete